ncbi:MAG: DNA double-strand break repair nuclease NurA [Anaerolineaceae bacterium]|nr:DNA double-strand break repair nuclease NurA [Anaerolineaceae bacterium]
MPINYLKIQEQIPDFVNLHHQAHLKRENLKDFAIELLHQVAQGKDNIEKYIEVEKQSNQYLQCAGPSDEFMSTIFPDEMNDDTTWQILGIDGSQITPDSHSPLSYGLVNIGIFVIPVDSTTPPYQQIQSEFIYHVEDENQLQFPNEEQINIKRDLEERRVLVQLSLETPDSIIALTDGPLSIFREPKENTVFFRQYETLIKAYEKLPSPSRIIAGYVDRPRSNMVVQMLNIWLKNQDSSKEPLTDFRDSDLFNTLIPSGSRSAVFTLHSRSGRLFQGDIGLHFFYLNVSPDQHPALVRVEIPAWVAKDSALINQLHQQLLQQCRILGTRPYPYVLHRAHEIAVVHQDEKHNLETMMMKHWLDKGLPLSDFSYKQILKNMVGSRRRMP